MEGAGVTDLPQCLLIRGISDYADAHKKPLWQNNAAATAAVFARELLMKISPTNVADVPPMRNFESPVETKRSSIQFPLEGSTLTFD